MKKFIIATILFTILLISCKKHEQFIIPQKIQNNHYSVSEESALKLVKIIEGNFDIKTKSSGYNVKPYVRDEDTLMYIINKPKGGWYLISGDKRTPEVLAESGTGTFNMNSLNENAKYWINDMLDYIYSVKNNLEITKANTTIIESIWDKIENKTNNGTKNIEEADGFYQLVHVHGVDNKQTYGPYLKTKWGQSHPWNTCVPYISDQITRAKVGCVAVSGAQILYYLHYKIGIPENSFSIGTCSGYSNNGEERFSFNFNAPSSTVWDQMAVNSQDYSRNTSLSAILMGNVGYLIGMKYKDNLSTAKITDLKNRVFSYYDIDCNYGEYDYNLAIDNLMNGNPIILGATSSNGKSHAWIADGYYKKITHWTYYYIWRLSSEFNDAGDDMGDVNLEYDENGLPINYDLIDTGKSIYHCLYMNWGWNGSYDNARYSVYGNWSISEVDRNYNSEKVMLYNFKIK